VIGRGFDDTAVIDLIPAAMSTSFGVRFGRRQRSDRRIAWKHLLSKEGICHL
jgi:hypothetical protein